VDDQVGRMMQFMDVYDKEVGRPSLVIFTSDHGSMLYDHGIDDKHTLHTVRERRRKRERQCVCLCVVYMYLFDCSSLFVFVCAEQKF
jgi:hypothetical protein